MATVVGNQHSTRGQRVGGNHHIQFAYGLPRADQLVAYVSVPICGLGVPRLDANHLQKLAHRQMQAMIGLQALKSVLQFGSRHH